MFEKSLESFTPTRYSFKRSRREHESTAAFSLHQDLTSLENTRLDLETHKENYDSNQTDLEI